MELKKNGIYDKSVLNVIEDVDRSLFVDENLKQKSNLNIACQLIAVRPTLSTISRRLHDTIFES